MASRAHNMSKMLDFLVHHAVGFGENREQGQARSSPAFGKTVGRVRADL